MVGQHKNTGKEGELLDYTNERSALERNETADYSVAWGVAYESWSYSFRRGRQKGKSKCAIMLYNTEMMKNTDSLLKI